jgi:hypothetical protein
MNSLKLNMNSLKLNAPFSLGIEIDKKRARLIVYNNGVEEVCRKEYLNKFTRFISSEDERLFKGRLQLFKHEGGIGIEVKGKYAGTIKPEYLLLLLPNFPR